MAITAEQKADAGQRFLNHLKERIALREKKQKEANATKHAAQEGSELMKLCHAWWADRTLPGKLTDVGFEWERYNGTRVDCVVMSAGGAKVSIDIRHVPGADTLRKDGIKAEELAQSLCKELEFLHEQLDRVAQFQAHVARLWAPASKTNVLSQTRFMELVDDFLSAKRPAVCAI